MKIIFQQQPHHQHSTDSLVSPRGRLLSKLVESVTLKAIGCAHQLIRSWCFTSSSWCGAPADRLYPIRTSCWCSGMNASHCPAIWIVTHTTLFSAGANYYNVQQPLSGSCHRRPAIACRRPHCHCM